MRPWLLVRSLVLVALLIGTSMLATLGTAYAGADAVKLVVKQVNSDRTFEVTEPSLLGFLSFADLTKPLDFTPQVTGGYEITRYWPNGPFDHFHYYPGTETTPGYIFYDGFIQGWSDSAGKWYQAREKTDQRMRDLLAIPPAGPTPTTTLEPGVMLGAVSLAILTVGGIILAMRRNMRLGKRAA